MRLLSLLLFTFLCTCVRAQTGEFEIHQNGYIYPEATMTDLAFIVDSLDLKFKQCDLDRAYLAPAQTMASYYTVSTKNWKNVRDRLAKAAANGRVDVKALYPAAKLIRRGIMYVSTDTEDEDEHRRQFNLLPLNYGYSISLQPESENVGLVNELIYVKKSSKTTQIWVLDAPPSIREIPETYARMIQYVDCMVDTTQNIYREEAIRSTGGYLADGKDQDAGERLLKMVKNYPGKEPEYIWNKEEPSEKEITEWYEATAAYETGQLNWVREQVKTNPKMQAVMKKTKAMIRQGNSAGGRVEQFLEACGEHAAALESKRLRRVYGSCSQDDSPRIHAMEIARLSAASVEWPVFLRAHLNIMNDRFDRVTDGSYAYAGRGTYLAELEALGIDATGLLIGSCLRAEKLAGNHYHSNWSRVGRALTEAKDPDAVVAMLTNIIRDPELDDLNRMTGVYLLRFMASNHGKEETDQRYTRALATAVAGLGAEWAKLVEVE